MKIKKKNWYLFFTGAAAIGALWIFLAYGDHWARAQEYLGEMNPVYFVLLIPMVWGMYIMAGGIWAPYFKEEGLSTLFLGRVQYELAFVNGMVPFLDVLSGVEYAEARLSKLDVSREKSNSMYTFRYVISIVTKWLEIAVALMVVVKMSDDGVAKWAIWLIALVTVGIMILFFAGLVCYNARANLRWPYKKPWRKIGTMFIELGAAETRGGFMSSFWAGMVYSFAEVAPYLIVAAAFGHVEAFLPIMAASGLGIGAGIATCTPMGIGGFEAAVALLAWGMGIDPVLTVVVLVVERILMTVGNSLVGYRFWKRGAQEIAGVK